jgi:hypothetical protein
MYKTNVVMKGKDHEKGSSHIVGRSGTRRFHVRRLQIERVEEDHDNEDDHTAIHDDPRNKVTLAQLAGL